MKRGILIILLFATAVSGLSSFWGPLRNTHPGSWVANRLAWINDTNDVNSVLDLTDWIAGTANQIYRTDDGDGSLTLNLPQDINTTSSPNFQALTTVGTISAGADTDINNVFGRWIMGYESTFGADAALLAHYDMFTPTDFALAQDNAGDTWLNSGHYTYLCADGTYYARLYTAGGVTPTYHIIGGVTLAIGGALGSERVEITQSGTNPTILDVNTDYSNLFLNVNGVVAATDLQVSQGAQINGAFNFAPDVNAVDDYKITLTPAPTAYTTGMMITFSAVTANTGVCTLNANALGPKSLKAFHDQDPPNDYIEAGSIVMVVYDAAGNFQMLQADANP